MTRRLIAVQVDGVIMTLKGWQAHKLALEAGVKTLYNGVRQGFVGDSKRLGDLLAYCELRNVAVDVTGVADAPPAPDRAPVSPETPAQLDLFGDAS